MTALRFFATGKPSLIGMKVLPMSADDARFWQLLRASRASPEGTRPVGARSAKPIARGPAKQEAPKSHRITQPFMFLEGDEPGWWNRILGRNK